MRAAIALALVLLAAPGLALGSYTHPEKRFVLKAIEKLIETVQRENKDLRTMLHARIDVLESKMDDAALEDARREGRFIERLSKRMAGN